jgi:phage tail-like protein
MPTRNTPLGGFLFGLKITSDGLAADYTQGTAFFKQVSGLGTETEMTDYQQGGNTAYLHKLAGNRKWKNIILKAGFTGDPKLFKWKFAPTRVNGAIIMLGPDMVEMCRWEFKDGYPVKWDSSDLDATKNELSIETLEIAHHGLTFTNKQPAAAPPPPEPPPPPPPAPPIDATVNFPTGSSTVPSPNADLDAVSDTMKSNPEKKCKIEGDTDTVGSAASNKSLSQSRADSVKQYLINSGTPADQIISSIGYGKERALGAIADNKADASWRRTKVIDA